jgi:hypothetical protein
MPEYLGDVLDVMVPVTGSSAVAADSRPVSVGSDLVGRRYDENALLRSHQPHFRYVKSLESAGRTDEDIKQ